MSRKTSLLTALRKYRPREEKDPLENFITEAFAWLLRNHPGFGRFFLSRIRERLGMAGALTGESRIEWITQFNLGGKFPDLVAEAEGMRFIFEHKTGSPLHENQLGYYRHLAAEKYGSSGFRLILITAETSQHQQSPDLALCWREVHRWVEEWSALPDSAEDFLFGDFCRLLEAEGFGPPAPVSHAAILAYLPARGFVDSIHRLAEAVSRHDWGQHLPPGAGKAEFCPLQWGRLGFTLLGRSPECWHPGIFAGFQLDNSDSRLSWLTPAGPDFSIVISFNAVSHPAYERDPLYRQMETELRTAVTNSDSGFEFHHHLMECHHPQGPNRWHPIHIRKPVLELLRGTVTAVDQEKRVIGEVRKVLTLISNCKAFWELHSSLAIPAGAPSAGTSSSGAVTTDPMAAAPL